jgi:hypothetical protein
MANQRNKLGSEKKIQQYYCTFILSGTRYKQLYRKRKRTELEFLNNLWGLGTDIGIGSSYWPARQARLAEFIPWN